MIYLRGHHLILLYGYMASYDNEYRLNLKRKNLIQTAINHGHSKNHGLNIIRVLEDAMNPNEKIKMIDALDDICATCNSKKKISCKEFIPYDFSASCEDRSCLHFYGLKRREYTAKFIKKRLDEKGIF